jgi:acyl carrier protein
VPDRAAPQEHVAVAPRTQWEQRLAELWADELHVTNVGAHDNFFDIGGSSLKVITMLQRLQAGFGVSLTPDMVYTAPTVAELAKARLI